MKKGGEEILQGTTLGMERLHRRVTGSDIEGGGNNKEKQQQKTTTKNKKITTNKSILWSMTILCFTYRSTQGLT